MTTTPEAKVLSETDHEDHWRNTDLPLEVKAKAATIDRTWSLFQKRGMPETLLPPGKLHSMAQATAKLHVTGHPDQRNQKLRKRCIAEIKEFGPQTPKEPIDDFDKLFLHYKKALEEMLQ